VRDVGIDIDRHLHHGCLRHRCDATAVVGE
jgi:hypothetical protein